MYFESWKKQDHVNFTFNDFTGSFQLKNGRFSSFHLESESVHRQKIIEYSNLNDFYLKWNRSFYLQILTFSNESDSTFELFLSKIKGGKMMIVFKKTIHFLLFPNSVSSFDHFLLKLIETHRKETIIRLFFINLKTVSLSKLWSIEVFAHFCSWKWRSVLPELKFDWILKKKISQYLWDEVKRFYSFRFPSVKYAIKNAFICRFRTIRIVW